MSRIVQEKFQVNYPQQRNDDSQGGWASDKSARLSKTYRGGKAPSQPLDLVVETKGDFGPKSLNPRSDSHFYQSLPPGMDLTDQEVSCQPEQSFGGSLGSGTQVTDDVTSESLKAGFDRKSLRPTDDMYTREHQDAFYEDVTVDGVTGFLERNNMLDRS